MNTASPPPSSSLLANCLSQVVSYLLEQGADPSLQNDLGQTPLFVASMHGHVKCCEKLISGGTDMRRLSIDGKNALNVAGNGECRFLLRSLQNEDEEEEALRKAEETKRRLELMMLRWAKASMVDGYKTWKEWALIPESKITRLVSILDAVGYEQHYESPQVGIVTHAQGRKMDSDGAQFVVYSGRKALGVQTGSGHPLIHGLDEAWELQKGSLRPSTNESRDRRVAVENRGKRLDWTSGRIELPDLVLKKVYNESEASRLQLEELEEDLWGLRSISTARQWSKVVVKHLTTAEKIVTRFHYVMTDPRPGTGLSNLETIRNAVLRMVDRLVRPHRTMLHGLRPRAMRSNAVKNSQALVNSSAFPPNFPGAPSDRRLFTSRFVHAWAWMTACNNPPGYLPIPELQDVVQRVAAPLQLDQHPDFVYLMHESFKPVTEGDRWYVQPLNIPLPPRHCTPESSVLFYAKAIAKVEDEPAAAVNVRPRAKSPGRNDYDDEAFQGAMLLASGTGGGVYGNDFVDEFVF